MTAFGRAKIKFLKRFLDLRHGVPSHDTFSTVFRILDPKALDEAFGTLVRGLVAALAKGGVIAIDGKSLKGAYDKGEAHAPEMMVSAFATGLRLTLATVAAKKGNEVDAALEVLGLIDLKGMIVTGDACIAIARWPRRSWPRAATTASRSRAIRTGCCRTRARPRQGQAKASSRRETETRAHGRVETRPASSWP